MRSWNFRMLLLLVGAIALLGGAVTNSWADTGSLQVTVADKDGPIPGATVTLTDANRQYPAQTLITNDKGQVIFGAVQPGSNYIISVDMDGYSKYSKRDLRVQGGVTTQLRAGLIAEIKEQVTVIGKEKVVELDADSQGKTTITAEAFQDLPVFGRDYQSVLTLAPGVQDADGDGNPNVLGARDRDFKMTVDGVSNVDPLTGKFMSDINPDSIEEIQIIDAGADASYGGAFAFGKMITKSGGNKFQGTFNLFLQDSIVNKRPSNGANLPKYSKLQPSLLFSGPIVRDKLWFYTSYWYSKEDYPIVLTNGNGAVTNVTRERPDVKLTWQVTPKNKLQFEYRADPMEAKPAGLDQFTPPASGYFIKRRGPTYSANWTAPFSPSFFWEAQVAFSDINIKYGPYDPSAKNGCYSPDSANPQWDFLASYYCESRGVSNDTNGVTGAFPWLHDDKRQRWTYKLDADQFLDRWLGGQHRIKFGFELARAQYQRDETLSPYMIKRLNAGASRSADQGFDPSAPLSSMALVSSYFPGQGVATLNSIMRPQRGRDRSLGNYYAAYVTDSYEPRENLSIQVGARFSREELSSDGYNRFDPLTERGLYDTAMIDCSSKCTALCISGTTTDCKSCLDDCSGQAYQQLTIHPLDDPSMTVLEGGTDPTCSLAINPEQCNTLARASQAGPLKIRQTERFMIVNNNIAPRFSVQWDPQNTGKSKLVASWGRYYQDTILEPLVEENGPDDIRQQFSLNGDNNITDSASEQTPFPRSGVPAAFSIRYVDRNLKPQYNDELAISYEREIARETSMSVRYVNRKYRDQLQAKDINHRAITDAEMWARPDNMGPADRSQPCPKVRGYWDCTGLQVRIPEGSYWRVEYTDDGLPDLAPVDPEYNNIWKISNYNNTDYTAYILELTRRYYQDWEMQASYTWSKAFGDAEDYIGTGLGGDVTNADLERGYLSYDQRHSVKLNGRVYIRKFGGFRLGGVVSWESGLPYSLYEQRQVWDFPTDLTAGLGAVYNLPGWAIRTKGFATDRTVFITGQRNDQRNPSQWMLSANMQKEFMIKDLRATLQVDMINILNNEPFQLAGIERITTSAQREARKQYYYQPVGYYNWGRRFQIAFKINWN